MHDQDIRPLRELDEIWIGSVLIGAEYDRHIPRFHTVRQGRHVAVRYSQRSHGQSLPVEYGRRLWFRHINDTNIEANASALVLFATQRGAENLECAILLIEEATEERREAWCRIVAGRPDNR